MFEWFPGSDKVVVAGLVFGVRRLACRSVETVSVCAIKLLKVRLFLGPSFFIGDGWQ